jgi:Spy/CpxP family protein refolding chaperone
MKTKLVCLFMFATAAFAQGPPPGGGPPPNDPVQENLFPPELVMQNQKAIGLTADQQAAIRAEMQTVMTRFTDLQWQQSAEAETMNAFLKQDRADERQVLAQLDKLLAIEAEVKKLHLTALVRVKNILTAEQQAKLKELKKQSPRRGRPMRPPEEE